MSRHIVNCPLCFGRIYLDDDIDNLCSVFAGAASKTWVDLRDSHNFGAAISEDSITDMLLLEMRRRTKQLVYKRYTRHEEHKESGADWLWWFVSGDRGFPLLVQAKRLYPNRRYESLKYKKHKSDQTNTLLRHAKQEGWLPLFCFYNFWNPSSPPWPNGPDKLESSRWGCAVASARPIKKFLQKHGAQGNKISFVGPVSIPWERLVCPTLDIEHETLPTDLPDIVRETAKKALRLRAVPDVQDGLPQEVQQLLGRTADKTGLEQSRELNFLKGIIVVSDRPIGEGD